MRLMRQKYVNIHSIPELHRAKEKSVQMAKKVIDRISRVLERQLLIKKNEVEVYKNAAEMFSILGEEGLKEVEDDLKLLAEKFNNYRVTPITSDEIKEIDEEMDQKINEFLTRMGHFEEQKDAHFCIYRGISEEMEETEKFLDVTGDKAMEEVRKFEDFLERRVSKISKLKEPMKTSAERIFLFELVENSFDVDKLIITGLEGQYRFVMTQLIWARVFPHSPAINSEEAFYSHLLSERFLTKNHGEGSFLSKLFSTAMCG